MLSRSVRDVVGVGIYDIRRASIERALQGERVEFENDATAMGMTRSMHTCYIPDRDAQGGVRAFYAISSDITLMKQTQQQLQSLARFDNLTGLANRLLFNEKLPEALLRSERSGLGVAVLYLDVDHFKRINDTLGHAAGDAVLKECALRLTASVRASDTVARLGGDEFVVILEGLHEVDELDVVGRKIVAAFVEPMQPHGNGPQVPVSASVGGGYQAPGSGSVAPADLLARADAALYAAKAASRNTFRVAGAQPQHHSAGRTPIS